MTTVNIGYGRKILTRKKASHAARAYHHGDLKNALVAAALALIAKQGPRALSLREVARSTGVSHASTYRHFHNKESLLASIAEQGFRELTEMMRAAALRSADDSLKCLHRVGLAYVAFGVAHPHHLEIMFGNFITSHASYPTLLEAGAEAFDVLASAVREGQAAGRIRLRNERLVSLAAWSQVHGLALLIAFGQIRPDGAESIKPEALAAEVLTLLQEGLAT